MLKQKHEGKLGLRRETVRNLVALDDSQQAQIQGGVWTVTSSAPCAAVTIGLVVFAAYTAGRNTTR